MHKIMLTEIIFTKEMYIQFDTNDKNTVYTNTEMQNLKTSYI